MEMEGAQSATGISFSSAGTAASEPDDPEMLEKASRCRFTAKYRQGILEEASTAVRVRSVPCCFVRSCTLPT